MRKFVSIILNLSILMSLSVPVFAYNAEVPAMESRQRMGDENVLFSDGLHAEELTPNFIEYTYAIDETSDENLVNVNMDVVLNYSTNRVPFRVIGEIPVYALSSGQEYMYGALEGNVELAGTDYKATVGFQKFNNDSAISATLTLEKEDAEVIFKFGDLHVKYDAVKEVLPNQVDVMSADKVVMREEPEGDYQYRTSSVGQLNGKNAIKETVSYFAKKRRIMLTVTPYLQNVESIHTISGTTTASVSVDRIKLKIEELGSSETHISGLIIGSTSAIGESGGEASGKNALAVISSIGVLMYPKASSAVGVFNALVNALSLSAKATLTLSADRVSAEYSNLRMANKNWDSYGVSLACQLVPLNSPSPTVKAAYNYWSEIRYYVSVTDFMGDVSHVYRTVETSKDYTITTA